MSKQLKPIPKIANEPEEQAFWEKARLHRLSGLDESPTGCAA